MSFSQINWSLSDTGIPSGYSPNDFTILPNGDIYLACSQFVSTSFTPKLMKSEDSGSTWKEISMSGLTSLQNTNAIQYHAGKLLLSGSNSANAAYYVYSSIDSGKNWSLSNTGIPSGYSPNDFTILPNGDIYLACSQFVSTSFAPKLMKSEDSGSTWKEISMSGLTSLQNTNSIQYYAGKLLLSGSNSVSGSYYVFRSELIYSPPTRTLKDNVILDVAIFPNPVSTLLYIENVDCTYYRVFDINGKILSDGNLSLGLNSINLSNLPKGEYIIQVKNLTNAMYATVIKL
ncbi:MAG TPA: T9SS type A sorting domain-containing protein [Flavipsychrobacter sp.]